MARLTAPTSVKGTEAAVVEVRDDLADELKRRGFTEAKAASKKASSSKSDK
jgi:hypothetical protein